MTAPTRWRDRAACQGMDSELFFPVSGKREHATQALQACATCPVRQPCLSDAVERGDDWAVLGGHTAKERQGMRDAVASKRVRQSIRYHIDRGRSDDDIAARVGVTSAAVAQLRAGGPTADRSGTRQPCGTPAAYRRHLRNGEEPCQPCRAAAAREHSDNKRRRQDAVA